MGCCDLFIGINSKDLDLPTYNLLHTNFVSNYDYI